MSRKPPSYRQHKASGQAIVTINGRDYYLGKHGSAASKTKYERLIGEYLLGNRSPSFGIPKAELTVGELLSSYLLHAQEYFGSNNTETKNIVLAMKPVRKLYEDLKVSAFEALQFKTVRRALITEVDPVRQKPRTRQYVNATMKRIVRIFKWGVGEGRVPPAVYHAIKEIPPLKIGRTNAPEAAPIVPVDDATVDATLPHLSPVVADMVRVQRATGCRPGEVCKIKPRMVDRSNDVWEIKLDQHKTAHKGKTRTLYCGPACKQVLAKYLLRDADAYCFSPAESAAQNRERRHASRVTPLSCGNKPGSNRVRGKRERLPGECFSAMTYARAISYGCRRAFPSPKGLTADQQKKWHSVHCWAPNRIRHSTATKIRKEFGIEAASVTLGHSGLAITETYAEQDRQKAIEVARRIG